MLLIQSLFDACLHLLCLLLLRDAQQSLRQKVQLVIVEKMDFGKGAS
jgi:hypothetical protein